MNLREVVRKIEAEFDVERVKVEKFGKSFQVYPWIKARLFSFLIVGDALLLEKNKGLYWKQFKSLFYGWWNMFRKYDTWVLTSSVERKLIDGKHYDKLFDYYALNSGRKTLLIEAQYPQGYNRSQVATKYVMSKAVFFFLEMIYRKLFLRKISVERSEVIDQVKAHLKTDVDLNYYIRKNLAQYKVMRFWLKLFPKPKEILLSVGYTNFGYIQAFKENNIPVYEFQHGLINDQHQGYNYFKEFEQSNFPDAIATFGHDEVVILTQNNKIMLTQGAFAIGSFILQNKLENFNNCIDSNSADKKIAVTLQDGEIADKLVRQLNDLSIIGFVFYLKPRKSPVSYYRDLVDIKPHIKLISNVDTYDLIRSCDAHLTVYSTCATESVVLGRPTFFLDIQGYSSKHFKEILPPSEFVSYAQNAEELKTILVNYNFNYQEKEIMEKYSDKIATGYFKNIQTFAKSLEQ